MRYLKQMFGAAVMASLMMSAAACVSATAIPLYRNDEEEALDTVGATDTASPARESITGGINNAQTGGIDNTPINNLTTANDRTDRKALGCNQLKAGHEVSQRDISLV